MQRTVPLSVSHFQHRLQQHITACLEVLRLGVFRFIMGDPVLAGHKDHAGNGDLRQVKGVVPSDADHLHSTILSLVEELSVTRDRADAFERLLEQSGVLNSTQLDQYQADDVAAAEQQERRERFIARVFKTFADEAERETEDLLASSLAEIVRIVDQ